MQRNYTKATLTILILLCFSSPHGYSQSVSALFFKPQHHDAALLTSYSNIAPNEQQDSLFIVTTPADGSPTTVTLTGRVSDGKSARLEIQTIQFATTDYTYSWKTIAEEASSTGISVAITLTAPTAYRIIRVEGSDTIQKRIWVIADNVKLLNLYIEDKCSARTIMPRFNYDWSTITDELFTYSDLTSKYLLPITAIGRIYFKNFQWVDERQNSLTDFSTSTLKIAQPAPLEPQGYRLIVTNFYNRTLSAASDVLDPISVESVLNVQYIDKPDATAPTWQRAGNSLTHEAPLYLKLADNSKNADSVIWTIRNDPRAVRSGAADTLFIERALASERITPEIDHNLFSAGTYVATLRTVNNRQGCIDTANVTLNVDSSLINTREIPNVFTPNGDFINDLFRFKNPETSVRSIREFSIEIFNRGGQQVYFYTGNPRAWGGWNGKRNNTGADEPQGIYFFIIQANGWDGKTFRGETYRGFVHLYR